MAFTSLHGQPGRSHTALGTLLTATLMTIIDVAQEVWPLGLYQVALLRWLIRRRGEPSAVASQMARASSVNAAARWVVVGASSPRLQKPLCKFCKTACPLIPTCAERSV
jgi:hypothetical protein